MARRRGGARRAHRARARRQHRRVIHHHHRPANHRRRLIFMGRNTQTQHNVGDHTVVSLHSSVTRANMPTIAQHQKKLVVVMIIAFFLMATGGIIFGTSQSTAGWILIGIGFMLFFFTAFSLVQRSCHQTQLRQQGQPQVAVVAQPMPPNTTYPQGGATDGLPGYSEVHSYATSNTSAPFPPNPDPNNYNPYPTQTGVPPYPTNIAATPAYSEYPAQIVAVPPYPSYPGDTSITVPNPQPYTGQDASSHPPEAAPPSYEDVIKGPP